MPFIGKIVDVPATAQIIQVTKLAKISPVVRQRQVPQVQKVLVNVAVSLAQFVGTVVEVPVIMQIMASMPRQVSQIHGTLKTVEIPPAQFVGTMVVVPVFMPTFLRWSRPLPSSAPGASSKTQATILRRYRSPMVSGALAWLTSRPARVDQPPVQHTRHGFRLRWAHEASSQWR